LGRGEAFSGEIHIGRLNPEKCLALESDAVETLFPETDISDGTVTSWSSFWENSEKDTVWT
jgi:hypothetical protein